MNQLLSLGLPLKASITNLFDHRSVAKKYANTWRICENADFLNRVSCITVHIMHEVASADFEFH